MDPALIIAICGLLGALGGLFHWLTPDPQGTPDDNVLKRVIIGAIAGAVVGSPTLYGALQLDFSTVIGMLAVMTAATGVMATGYGGIEIKNLVTGSPKPPVQPVKVQEISEEERKEITKDLPIQGTE